MGLRKLLVLLAILALLGAAVGVKATRRKVPVGNPATIGTQALLPKEFSNESVKVVDIEQKGEGTGRIRLEKNPGGEWTIASHYGAHARKDSVDGFLDKVKFLRGEVRSENREVLGDYSLTEEKAIRITVLGASDVKLADVLLSPQHPRGSQNFVRPAGDSRVIVTDTDLLASLGLYSFTNQTRIQYRSFADLRVASVEGTKVRAFEILPPSGNALSFEKTETEKGGVVWKMAGEAVEIDTDKVNTFFSSIYNLTADDNVDPAPKTADFASGKAWLRFTLGTAASPQTIEVFLGGTDPEKKLRYLKSMPDGIVYEVSGSSVDDLLKKDKDSFIKQKSG